MFLLPVQIKFHSKFSKETCDETYSLVLVASLVNGPWDHHLGLLVMASSAPSREFSSCGSQERTGQLRTHYFAYHLRTWREEILPWHRGGSLNHDLIMPVFYVKEGRFSHTGRTVLPRVLAVPIALFMSIEPFYA